MTGVEILTSSEVAVEWAFNWTLFWIVGGIILVIFTIVGIWFWANDDYDWGIIPILFIVGMVFGILFGCMVGNGIGKPIEYTTEYKVTISDEVSMTEFYEHYKVISQDGKIFTVREKSE